MAYRDTVMKRDHHFRSRGVLLLWFILPASNFPALTKNAPSPQSREESPYHFIQTEPQYFALLEQADSLTFQHELEAEFLLLLDEQEMKDYALLPHLSARKIFIELYWKAHNPNPLLPVNDRLLVHLRRRAYARQEFSFSKPPYFDDRGKYHIKYGKPLHRLQDIGGQRTAKNPDGIPFKFHSHYSVKENESWSYVNIEPDFVVHFVRDGESFQEIRSLKEVIDGSHRRDILLPQLADVFKRRFWMSSAINDAVTEIEALESGFTFERIDLIGGLSKYTQQAEYETKQAKLEAPPTASAGINAVNKLPFSDAVAQFRGPEGRTRVEFALLSPLKTYVGRFDALTTDTVNVEFSCLLRDRKFDALADARLQRKFPAKLAVLENLSHAVGHLAIIAPAQPSELTLQVKNESDGKLGFAQRSINIRDFSGRQLMMSDVQFFAGVASANQRQVLPAFERQYVEVAPYPYEEVRKSLPLFCYFEVYNLKSAGFEDEYQITYKVVKDRSRQSVFKKISKVFSGTQEISISVTNTRPVIDDTARELIALDLSNLSKGAYRLEVIVAAVKDSAISASAQKDFMISD